MFIKKSLLLLLLVGLVLSCSNCSNIANFWKKAFGPKAEKKQIAAEPSIGKLHKPFKTSTNEAILMQQVLAHGPIELSGESNIAKVDLTTPSIESTTGVTFESFFEEMPPEQKEKEVGNGYEIWIVGGLFSGAAALNGEIRFPLQRVFGPATTTIRYLFGLIQKSDSSVRYYPIQADYIFNFPAGYITGVENYIGIGINFTLYSTGAGIGRIGGQLCYGIQSDGFNGKLFGEMGYGLINSGSFDSSQKGISLLIGYRKSWPFY